MELENWAKSRVITKIKTAFQGGFMLGFWDFCSICAIGLFVWFTVDSWKNG